MRMKFAAAWIFLAAAGYVEAQVVLSRRIYAERGRTWRQLWIARGDGASFTQLTRSPRDHAEPLCSRDGKLIYFVSDPDGARSLNAYAGANDRELWVFDTQSGHELPLWQTSDDDGLHLNGVTADGGVLVRVGTELRCLLKHPWKIDKVDPDYSAAAVSPDGRKLAIVIAAYLDKEGQSHDTKLFIIDTATGKSRGQVGNEAAKYEAPAWSPDGARIAAVAGDRLAIIDAATRKEVVRFNWPKADALPEELQWSPDGKYVLAGLYGEEGGAGDPQRDYFLLNLAAGTWTPEMTAQKAVWLRGGAALLYMRPVETTPLGAGKHA
jgi:Tol biopolymer transport system component